MSPPRYRVELYREASGYCQVENWLKSLARSNPKTAAKAVWLLDLLAAEGEGLSAPYVKHIAGPIYELRAKRSHDAVRIYYWRQEATLFVAAAGEVKKQDKADPKLVEYAVKAFESYQEE